MKHLLYAYRAYLSGIHLMRTGHVVANITVLNELFRLAEVDELVQRKREGAEKMRLRDTEIALHDQYFDLSLPKTRSAHKSRGLPHVMMMKATDFGQFNYLPQFRSLHRSRLGGVAVQRQVATWPMVVFEVTAQHAM